MIDFITQWHTQMFNADRIPAILAAWLLTVLMGMISGPLAGYVHPLSWQFFDRLFGRFGEKLDKARRPQADLMFRGFMVSSLTLLLAFALGKAYEAYIPMGLHYNIWPVLCCSFLLTSGAVWFSLLRLYFAQEQDKVEPFIYRAIQKSTRISLANSDDYGVTRAAISLSAMTFDKGLVAPAIWYIIGGFPIAIIYTALAALSWRFGKSGFHSGFAAVPVALERLMGFVPALFAAMLLNIAAFITPTAKLGKSLTAWLGRKGRAPYEQGGFPLSALAYALNITLGGGVKDLSGTAIKGEWVGPKGATAKVDHGHLRRALYINVIAQILFVASMLSAYVWSGVLLPH